MLAMLGLARVCKLETRLTASLASIKITRPAFFRDEQHSKCTSNVKHVHCHVDMRVCDAIDDAVFPCSIDGFVHQSPYSPDDIPFGGKLGSAFGWQHMRWPCISKTARIVRASILFQRPSIRGTMATHRKADGGSAAFGTARTGASVDLVQTSPVSTRYRTPSWQDRCPGKNCTVPLKGEGLRVQSHVSWPEVSYT